MGWKAKTCFLNCPSGHFPSCLLAENVLLKGRKWHFRDPKLKNFLEYALRTPSLSFLPVRTPSKSGWVTSRNHQAYFIIFHLRWRINGKFGHRLTHQKKAQARNCNQPFNLMERKRANFNVIASTKKIDSCASTWAYVLYVQAVVKVK